MILPAPAVHDVHGLRIRTTLALAAPVVAGDAFDVDVRLGPPAPVPSERPAGDRVVSAARAGDSFRHVAVAAGPVTTLRVPRVCDFVIGPEPGSVECRPDPEADLGLVAVLAAGLLVGYVLIAGGELALHASAVEIDGGAVAFLGPSGMGKSTVAGLCCAAGTLLVTDDVLRLDVSGPGVVCAGGSGHIRLRPHASWVIDLLSPPPATTTSSDGRVTAVLPTSTRRPLPLATVVLLRPSREVDEVVVRPLGGAAAFARVMAELRVGGWEDDGVGRHLLGAVAAVVDRVPVVEVDLPWATGSETSVAPALIERLRNLR